MEQNDSLNSRETRPARIILEYLQAKEKLEKQNIHNTIVMFGSARILPKDVSKQNLDKALKNYQSSPSSEEAKKLLELAKNKYEISDYYEKAYQLAYKFAQWSKTLSNKEKYYICTGGGPGIMEACNKGAFDAKEKSIGLNIELPFEQGANKYVSDELLMNFNYFFMRKFWFAYFAKAFVVFPGGFGTMDELFEMLTLVQTNKMKKQLPFVLFGKDFFNQVMNIDLFEKYSLISLKDQDLFFITDSIEDAFNHVTTKLVNIKQNV